MPIEYAPKTEWPLKGWQFVHGIYDLHDAWYSGDPARLAMVYSRMIRNPFDSESSLFARQAAGKRRTLLHVPVAGDLSSTSAAWLFGEHPKVSCDGADEEAPDPIAQASQARIHEIIEQGQVWNRISEAGETCSAMGGVVIKIDWDTTLVKWPILSVVQPDSCVPEFRFGVMVSCEFWKEIENDGKTVLRLIERREKGYIYNALYSGTPKEIGNPIALDAHTATAGLPESIPTGIDDLLCRYVPNLRPNRRLRKGLSGVSADCLYCGQSDYSGSETLMESLDETFTSLMRDIRIGAGKLSVPMEMLARDANGKLRFDYDEELFIQLNTAPSQEDKVGITATQFVIRTQEHLGAANGLYRQIVTNAGYSPQSFGLDIQGQAESGTALNVREGKTVRITNRKADYWKPALQDLFGLMLEVDSRFLGGTAQPMAVDVEMQDGVKTGLQDIAPSVEILNRAAAASTEVKVRMVHPDWPTDKVKAEVEKIEAQTGLNVADPTQLGVDGGAV